MEMIYQLILTYAERVILAVIFLLIGLFVISRIAIYISKKMEERQFDESLRSFLVPLIKVTLQVLLIISIASMLGAEVASFVAVLAAISFALGFALQGSLANFAGGVLILILKPFKAGDYIEAGGYAGTVAEIQVFYTILNTPDNCKVIIPNAQLSNNSAVNYSAYETRRVDFKFGVGYQDDLQKVKSVLQRIAGEHPLVLKEPEPMIVLGELGDSALIFYFRVWCKAADYWTLYFDMMEKVKTAFDKEEINIPFPQLDVHMATT